MKPLIEFYDSLLSSLSCHIDDDTREVSTFYDGEYSPVYIKKKQLLAVDQNLSRKGFSNPSRQIGFHPLSESASAVQMSEVHQWLLIAIRVRLNELFSKTAAKVMHNALSSEIQAAMKPSEAAAYMPLTGADSKTQKTLTDIIDNMDITNANRSMVHLRIKRGGTLNGKTYGRVVYVTFPILDELENNPECIFDVKVRKKDIPVLKALFEDIILNGKGGQMSDFSAANTTTTAPTLSALLVAYYNVLLRLNSLQKSLGKTISTVGLPVDVSWFPAISDFDTLRAMLPVLDGNSGSAPKTEEDERVAVKSPRQQAVDDSLEAENFSGLNSAVEEVKSPTQDNDLKNFLRAKPLDGAIRMPTVQTNNDPLLGGAHTNTIDTESMSPEQYTAYRAQQQAYNAHHGGGAGNNQIMRGRDMVLQQQQNPLGMLQQNQFQTNYTSPHFHQQQHGGQATVVGQASDGSMLIEVNGQIMKASGATASPGAQPNQSVSGTGAGRFGGFAK